ncbi:benenodin family lasso peptide [Sphingomonas sp. 1P08PE]
MCDHDTTADIVELGAASVETQGAYGPVIEPSAVGQLTGITDE